MLLCLHTAIAQQFKTSQGITTVTVVKPKSEPKAPKTKKEKSQKIEQSSGIVITAVLKSSGIIGNAYYTIGYKFNENIVAGGGVAANSRLRAMLAERTDLNCIFPPLKLCGDNGAMIAGVAYHFLQRGDRSGWDTTASARIPQFKRGLQRGKKK